MGKGCDLISPNALVMIGHARTTPSLSTHPAKPREAVPRHATPGPDKRLIKQRGAKA